MTDFNDEYNGGALVVTSIVLLILTFISVSLRFFVRICITKSVESDDWLILVSQLIFTVSCAFTLVGIHYGLGHHDLSLPMGARTKALEFQSFSTFTYAANMMFIKLSIAVFLLRIAVENRYIWTLKISMVVVAIWSLTIFFILIFECWPVAAQWDFSIPGKCYSGAAFVRVAYAFSVMTIITDWLYALMPIPMMWSVRMSLQTKSIVAFILGLGIFASIATLIRLKYLIDDENFQDLLFTGTNSMVWTLVEPGIAIIAASLITIRPLLRALNIAGFESTDPYNPNRRHTGQRLSLRGDLPANNPHTVAYSSGPSNSSAPKGSGINMEDRPNVLEMDAMRDGSEEYIIQQPEEGIRKTVDLTINSGVGRRPSWSPRNQDDGLSV